MDGSIIALPGPALASPSSAPLEPPLWPRADARIPAWGGGPPPRHVHLVPSMGLGGAERIVADLALGFAETGAPADVVALHDAPAEHAFDSRPGVELHRLGGMPWRERLAYAAGVIRASRLPAYCHLTGGRTLSHLWEAGCRTVPVVHNASVGWRHDPLAWNAPEVPFVVACGDTAAAELAAAGLRKPIRVLRHVAPAPPPLPEGRRSAVRAAFGAGPGTLLIGMVGRVVPQKRYTRAVRVLAELRRAGVDARLAVVGATVGHEGVLARAAMEREAAAHRVRPFLSMPGPVAGASAFLRAFDVFLNTSLYEGVSVATMEAVAAGVPVVTGDAGGQREAISTGDTLLCQSASDADWAAAVVEAAGRPARPRAVPGWLRLASVQAWPWTLALGPGAPPAVPGGGHGRCDVLFITGNLDVGGAQRSLCNLAAELPRVGVKPVVAVAGDLGVPGYAERAMAAGARFFDVSGGHGGGLAGRAGRILSLALAERPACIAFWNMDAATKMLVAKAVEGGPARLCDVSPGPMLYKEMDDAELAHVGRALSTGADAYVSSLDLLVAKYEGGGPPAGRSRPKRFAVIPNGVPFDAAPLARGDGPAPPAGFDPAMAVVTVGRLVPAKRPHLLPLVAEALGRLLPGASMTVVGGLHEGRSDEGWRAMLASCDGRLPANLFFSGPDHRATGFLPRFACFYMVSSDQGCPNASLEAMASGLPVVANPDGGTAEQVLHGATGLLVPDEGPPPAYAEALAAALASILRDPARARAMGEAGREHAAARFSIEAMGEAYARAFFA